jgi:hypothetical protein
MKELKNQAYLSIIIVGESISDLDLKQFKKLVASIGNLFTKFEIIIVVEKRLDQQLLKKLKQITSKLKVLVLKTASFDKGYYAGPDLAIGDFILEMKIETLIAKEKDIRKIVKLSAKGNDIISIVPAERAPLASRAFYKLLNIITHGEVSLRSEIARYISRRALNNLNKLLSSIADRRLLIEFTNYSVEVLQIEGIAHPRPKNVLLRLNRAVNIFLIYTDWGFYFVALGSLLFFFLSISIGIYAVYNYFFNNSVIEGWTTIMLFLSVGFSGIFFIFAMLSRLLSLSLRQLSNSPKYIIKEMVNL